MPQCEPRSLTLDDITEGQEASFRTTIDRAAVETFAALTGDINPLHVDDGFARRRGFDRRVVHGALLGGMFRDWWGCFSLVGTVCCSQCD
jgi:acyl dehydratase